MTLSVSFEVFPPKFNIQQGDIKVTQPTARTTWRDPRTGR
jgi:hypothetical protein